MIIIIIAVAYNRWLLHDAHAVVLRTLRCMHACMQDHDEVRGSGKRECYISGTPSQINEAKRLIFELLDQFESNRHGVQRVTMIHPSKPLTVAVTHCTTCNNRLENGTGTQAIAFP
jgi:hypothetical protein